MKVLLLRYTLIRKRLLNSPLHIGPISVIMRRNRGGLCNGMNCKLHDVSRPGSSFYQSINYLRGLYYMSEHITLDKLAKYLDFFQKMYDAVRIVDPVGKQVLEYRGCKIEETGKVCYDYWKSEKICDNCISVRAYHKNDSFMKLEQSPELIMMVTAFPVESLEKPVVLELLKNATESMMIGCGKYNEGHIMHNVISALNDIVIKDPLTSLYNRRFINERLPVDIVKATLEGWPLSIILMDIDNLKEINDTHGHIVGDQVLQETGNVLRSCIRAHNDWSARYGGDEFLICLNNANDDMAQDIAERIRSNIEKILIPVQHGSIHFTASLGIHTMKNAQLTAEEIIHFADQKMYVAKRQGRNRVVGSDETEND